MALSKPTGGRSLFSRLNPVSALKSFLQDKETTKPGHTFELFLKSFKEPNGGKSLLSRLNPFAALKSFILFAEQALPAKSCDTGLLETSESVKLDHLPSVSREPLVSQDSCNIIKVLQREGQVGTSKSVKLDPLKFGIGSSIISSNSCDVVKTQSSEGQMESSKLVKLDIMNSIKNAVISQDLSNAVKTLQKAGQVKNSKNFKLDSLKYGIRSSMVSRDSYNVVKALQSEGFEAYLVGGCVRDLLLKRIPKDFDVITTAKLDKVKKKFPRAIIVGERFPVCRVTLRNSVVEVTSFGTVDKQITTKLPKSHMPAGCDPSDYTRWKDSSRRDFTINSLFYDPLRNEIFDYTNAMMDLGSLKLTTIKPAITSFKEDKARILRGLRLAARLNLSFSKETESAIYDLSESVVDICKARLMMEINYMLSYGAAEASLLLLKKFKLLEIFLPFQDAYLSEKLDNKLDPRQSMLLKIFSNMDRLITCDRPCDGSLWVALLTFHLALFNNPQPAEVVLAFASLLYHGTWERSIKFARHNAPAAQMYAPEISIASEFLSDDEIARRVRELAMQVNHYVDVFIDPGRLSKAMARFPESPSYSLTLVSWRMGQRVEAIFKILGKDVTTLNKSKGVHEINSGERFVLGQIILDTLAPAFVPQTQVAETQKGDNAYEPIEVRLNTWKMIENGPITKSGNTKAKEWDREANRIIADREAAKAKKGDMHMLIDVLSEGNGATILKTKQENRVSAESGATQVKTKLESKPKAESGATQVKPKAENGATQMKPKQESKPKAETVATQMKPKQESKPKAESVATQKETKQETKMKTKQGNKPNAENGGTRVKKSDVQANVEGKKTKAKNYEFAAGTGAEMKNVEIHDIDMEIEELLGDIIEQKPLSSTDPTKGDYIPSTNDFLPHKGSDLSGHYTSPAEKEDPKVKIVEIEEKLPIVETKGAQVKKVYFQGERPIVSKVQKRGGIGELLAALKQIPCGQQQIPNPGMIDCAVTIRKNVVKLSIPAEKTENESSYSTIPDKTGGVEVDKVASTLSSMFK